jgi:hypothetical protein
MRAIGPQICGPPLSKEFKGQDNQQTTTTELHLSAQGPEDIHPFRESSSFSNECTEPEEPESDQAVLEARILDRSERSDAPHSKPVTGAPVQNPPAAAPSAPAAAASPELVKLVTQAEELFGQGIAGRVQDAVATYCLVWVAAALAIVRRRNGKIGNKPVESWGYVLNTLKGFHRVGGPPPEKPSAPPPAPRPREPAPPSDPKAGQMLAAWWRAVKAGQDPTAALEAIGRAEALAQAGQSP